MTPFNYIDEKTYTKIIDLIPILCVDIILTNTEGKYLLIKRANQPLLGQWWVIGGRVHKGEKIIDAVNRKVLEETRITASKLSFCGFYEDFFNETPFKNKVTLHSVSLVFKGSIKPGSKVTLDSQSSSWKFANDLPNRFKIITNKEFYFDTNLNKGLSH